MLNFTVKELVLLLRLAYAKYEEDYDNDYLEMVKKFREIIQIRESQGERV